MAVWTILEFLQSGLLWITTGVALLWIFRRVDDAAAVRMLAPVLILQAAGALAHGCALGMEFFIAHYSGAIYTTDAEALHARPIAASWWVFWLRIVAGLAPVTFLIPRLRRSMPVVTGISLACFTVISAGNLAGMVASPPP